MKKSKLLAPAFAFLALSTAAAVTGTVAWFTASRVVTISATAITAYNPEENLKVTLSGATAGATIVSGKNIDDKTAHGTDHADDAQVQIGALRDASVDLTASTPVVYGSVLSEDGSTVSAFKAITDANYAAGTYKKNSTETVSLYYAAKYTASFELVEGKSDKVYELLFDNTKTDALNPDSLALAAGLRIGYYVSSSSYFVLAPFASGTSLSSQTLLHANGETVAEAGSEAKYAAANSFYGDKVGTYKLGELQGSGTNLVTATVYTWFEGYDPTVINGNVNIERLLSVALDFRIAEKA